MVWFESLLQRYSRDISRDSYVLDSLSKLLSEAVRNDCNLAVAWT